MEGLKREDSTTQLQHQLDKPQFQFLNDLADGQLVKVYQSIFNAVQDISYHLRYSTVNRLGTKNQFGDERIDMDVQTDSLVSENLKKSKSVFMCLSEERPYPTYYSKTGEYVVTFDPIDGGNPMESNYTIGSIFGVWPKGEINGQTGRKMVTAALAVYGSRTSMILYNFKKQTLQEFTLRVKDDEEEFWEQTKEKIKVAKASRIFSPQNSKAILDNQAYRQVLEFWSKSGYALRYSGSLSADIYHMLIKGEGVYTSIGSKLQKRKLRILYECAPIAFLVEKAGGLSSNGEISLLDVVVDGYYQKTDFIVGSKDDVERVQRYVSADKQRKREEAKLSPKKKVKIRLPEKTDDEEEEDFEEDTGFI